MNNAILYLLILIPIFSILAILSYFINKNRKANGTKNYAYKKKEYLLTKPEHDFLNILQTILDNRYYIFPQIHISSLLEHEIVGQSWKGALSHIDRKSVDYVICDKTNISPLLVIELDDSSHSRNDRIERDRIVEEILKEANIPLLRIPLIEINQIDNLRNKIEQIIQYEKQ